MKRAGKGTDGPLNLDDVNWMEFRERVPGTCNTAILTTGTLEPHGIINNGADNLIPRQLAVEIAPQVNAMIAPHIPYGVTGRLATYPGSIHVAESAFRPYVREVASGLVGMGFRNVVMLNGHGGPQTAILESVSQELMLQGPGRFLVVNWWSTCSEVTRKVFGEDGGHAGVNETAMVQAYAPELVRRDLLRRADAMAFPPPGTWSAFPFPASIGLYRPGEGAPKDLDPKKAALYRKKVVAKLVTLIREVFARWERIER